MYQLVNFKKYDWGGCICPLLLYKSIVECFDKHYGNAISEMSKAAVNVHGN